MTVFGGLNENDHNTLHWSYGSRNTTTNSKTSKISSILWGIAKVKEGEWNKNQDLM